MNTQVIRQLLKKVSCESDEYGDCEASTFIYYFDSYDINNWLSYSNSLYIELYNSADVQSETCYYSPNRHTLQLVTYE